ncbi:MAG: hypothetical protein ACI4V1_05740, partial [Eubacteriales bacterium]
MKPNSPFQSSHLERKPGADDPICTRLSLFRPEGTFWHTGTREGGFPEKAPFTTPPPKLSKKEQKTGCLANHA